MRGWRQRWRCRTPPWSGTSGQKYFRVRDLLRQPGAQETDIAVVAGRGLAGVVGIGHHAHRYDVPGILAESEAIVLEHVAAEILPLPDLPFAACHDQHLDAVG